MKMLIRYLIIVAIACFIGFNAVEIKRLSQVRASGIEQFNAKDQAMLLWNEKMPAVIADAISFSALRNAISLEGEKALQEHANALAIGNYRYAVVRVYGRITSVKNDEMLIDIKDGDSLLPARLATEFIFGNAVRDASRLVSLKDFPNTTELNRISEELNNIVRTKVLPAFLQKVSQGDEVEVVAAIEVNKKHLNWQSLELIPISIQILP